jgi:hypothetical protein
MKDELIENVISDSVAFKNEENRHSSLSFALRDARKLSNRDMDSGNVTLPYEAPLFPDSWASALLYLIVLDQIGTCFINKTKKHHYFQGNAIYKAIKDFSDLSDPEAYAIESLRHSFAHNYGLCNVKKKKDTKEIIKSHTHIFVLFADENGQLIKLPKKGSEWNGNFDVKLEEAQTYINLWLFGDFVENLFRKLKEEYMKDNVELSSKIELNELRVRYTCLS